MLECDKFNFSVIVQFDQPPVSEVRARLACLMREQAARHGEGRNRTGDTTIFSETERGC